MLVANSAAPRKALEPDSCVMTGMYIASSYTHVQGLTANMHSFHLGLQYRLMRSPGLTNIFQTPTECRKFGLIGVCTSDISFRWFSGNF